MDTPSSRDEILAVSALAIAAGVGLGVIAFTKGGGGGTLPPGETLGNPQLALSGPISLPRGQPFTLHNPQVTYQGPGRNTYTYAQIKQGGVTVYGSGIAGVFVGPATTPSQFPLISATQPQPGGGVGPDLTLFPWPGTNPDGTNPVPICGAPAAVGPGDLHLQIYQDQHETGNPVDANGFSSPTCNDRQFIRETVYPGLIAFA